MVNTLLRPSPARYARTSRLVGAYVVLVVATLVVLAALSAGDSHQATSAAWGHAIVVAVFAALLPLRLRSARKGSADAARAVAIIAGVLAVVNVVEAALPATFPTWMRVEMVVIAVLMVAVVVAVRQDSSRPIR